MNQKIQVLHQESQVGNGWAQGGEQGSMGVHVPCHSQVLSSFTSKWIEISMNFHHSLLACCCLTAFRSSAQVWRDVLEPVCGDLDPVRVGVLGWDWAHLPWAHPSRRSSYWHRRLSQRASKKSSFCIEELEVAAVQICNSNWIACSLGWYVNSRESYRQSNWQLIALGTPLMRKSQSLPRIPGTVKLDDNEGDDCYYHGSLYKDEVTIMDNL